MSILPLPFRQTQPLVLSDAIKQYISSKYDQHPDDFRDDLQEIDALRNAATSSLEAHSTYLDRIHQYAAQLIWLTSKFPVDIGADFTWYPAIGYHTDRACVQNNIRFELANVLYNLAGLHSQLALGSNRSTPDGLKTACGHFMSAAGVLSHLKASIIPDMRSSPPEDMDELTLESLEKLMLAQAQECFWQKAVKDGSKDGTIARLAIQVSDYYNEAREWAIKSQAVTSEWIHHMNAKHHHFAAAAQYRASCDCMEKRKRGEEVARLLDAQDCANEGLKESRYVSKTVVTDLTNLKTRIQQVLKGAEKDNDTIYLEPVPSKSELRPLDRAAMVHARVPQQVTDAPTLLADGQLGRPLFSKLVPYSVHLAASVYSDRRDRLVNTKIVSQYEALTTKCHELLASLNLPGALQAVEKPLGLAPSVASHAQQVRQQGGIQRLETVIVETDKLRDEDNAIYTQAVDLLTQEAAQDEAARRKHGTQSWHRSRSEDANPKLFAQIGEIEGYLKQAATSDRLIQQKVRANQSLIRLLGGTDRDLEDYIPNSRRAHITPEVEREAGNLRIILNNLDRLIGRRKRRIEQVQTKAKADDVSRDLLREAAKLEREKPMQAIETAQFEDFFDKRLNMYAVDQREIASDAEAQERLLQQVQQANNTWNAARKGDSSTKEREEAIQNLEACFVAYQEIIKECEQARTFYNQLAGLVSRFRDDCRAFVLARREEAAALESDMANTLAQVQLQRQNELNLAQAQQRQRTQKSAQQVMRGHEPQMAAPRPTRAGIVPPKVPEADAGPKSGVWTPDVGIRFG